MSDTRGLIEGTTRDGLMEVTTITVPDRAYAGTCSLLEERDELDGSVSHTPCDEPQYSYLHIRHTGDTSCLACGTGQHVYCNPDDWHVNSYTPVDYQGGPWSEYVVMCEGHDKQYGDAVMDGEQPFGSHCTYIRVRPETAN